MIIETDFTDRDHAWIFRQLAQRRDYVLLGLLSVGWMNSDDGENVRIFFGKIDRPPAALDRGADGDDARHAGVSRATKHIVEIIREIRIIEMRVSFDQHCARERAAITIRLQCSPKSALHRTPPSKRSRHV